MQVGPDAPVKDRFLSAVERILNMVKNSGESSKPSNSTGEDESTEISDTENCESSDVEYLPRPKSLRPGSKSHTVAVSGEFSMHLRVMQNKSLSK